jgi:hypothetical protein
MDGSCYLAALEALDTLSCGLEMPLERLYYN